MSTRTEAETKAYNLHCALRSLLDAYRKNTNSDPMSEDETDPENRAERALFENAPLADWEGIDARQN